MKSTSLKWLGSFLKNKQNPQPFLSFFKLNFIGNIIYVIEKDICPSGLLIRVGRAEEGKWDECFQLFLLLLLYLLELGGGGAASCCQIILAPLMSP